MARKPKRRHLQITDESPKYRRMIACLDAMIEAGEASTRSEAAERCVRESRYWALLPETERSDKNRNGQH